MPLWYPMHQSQVRRWCPGLPPLSPTLVGAPPQLQMDLWDLNDAARWEVMAPTIGSPFHQWQVPVGGAAADLKQGDFILYGEGDGDLVSCHSTPQVSLKKRRMLVTSLAHMEPD